jgi:hypothetical protein
MVGRKVISTIHRYRSAQMTTMTRFRTSRLEQTAYKSSDKKASLPLHKMSGPNQSPNWYSPSASNWSQRDADLALLRQVSPNRLDNLQFAWLGQLAVGKHQLLLTLDNVQWFFPRIYFTDSALVCVPATKGYLPGYADPYWVEDDSWTKPMLIGLLELKDVMAVHYKWRSIEWQNLECPAAKGTVPPALRAFSESGAPQELVMVLAKEAFFTLKLANLKRLAKHLHIPLANDADLFDVLFTMVKHVLKITDDLVLAILAKRLARGDMRLQWSDELANLDEAAELLEKSDQPTVKESKEAAVKLKLEQQSFASDFRTRASAARVAAAKAAPKAKGKAKPKPAPRPRVPKWPDHNIPVQDARLFVPEGGKLWCSEAEGNWQAHYKPWRRVSRSWAKHGEADALNLCLQYLWEKHCLRHGLPADVVPLDLYPAPVAAAA